MTQALAIPVSGDDTLDALRTVKAVLAPDLTDPELQLFAMVAGRSGLDPFAKQIYAVKRSGRVTFQTGIDGYRSTAARTGEYDGSDEPEYGPIIEQPWPHPEWARVTVYRLRNGERRGQSATAYWSEFCPVGQDSMWRKMPRNQLAKCAEALAFRKAFPSVLADVYTDAEMDQAGPADRPELVRAAALPTAAERLAARRAAVEQPAASQTAQDAAPAADEIEGQATEIPAAAPATDGRCTAESPIDGARCGIAAHVQHKVHKQLQDGQPVQTWPAA